VDPLLRLLKNGARASTGDLAGQLNLTEEEIAGRIAEFEKQGVILGYHAVFDPEKIGDSIVTAVIEVKIVPERGGGFDRLASRIAKFEQVQSCYLMSGGYDLLVIVEGLNLQAVAAFIAEKLSTIKGVLSTSTHFRLKTYKENGAMLRRPEREERLAVAP